MRRLIAIAAALLVTVTSALAVMPDEILSDPALEARARALSKELRCMVCQNQSIDDSDAELARDLRIIVRERLVAGDSDAAVIDHVVARYGDYVLLRPRVTMHTMALWGAPVALLAFGVMFLALRRRSVSEPAARLSADEEARLEALLAEKREN